MEELKPCPFCGFTGVKTFENKEVGYETMWMAICTCGAEGPASETEEGACIAWNTRTPDVAKLSAELETMK